MRILVFERKPTYSSQIYLFITTVILSIMGTVGSIFEEISEEEKRAVLDFDCSVMAISNYILTKRPTKIVIMAGAGISVSAGIPDFRSPGTGLYHNLQKYNLSNPQDIFTLQFFLDNPQPFFDLAKAMYPTKFQPTPTHYFIRLLQEKGMLRRCYTQNIDTLERQAGVSPELLVEAHGSFGGATCTKCGATYPAKYFEDAIFKEIEGMATESDDAAFKANVCICEAPGCRGYVKPNIVFFGENLPARYFELRKSDLAETDLLIVMGTSLTVAPFSETLHFCSPHAPRLLINRELVGMQNYSWLSDGQGFKFDRCDNYRDVAFLGPCDENIFKLCDMLGWKDDFLSLMIREGASWRPHEAANLTSIEICRNQMRKLPQLQIATFVARISEGEELDSDDKSVCCLAKSVGKDGSVDLIFNGIDVPLETVVLISALTPQAYKGDYDRAYETAVKVKTTNTYCASTGQVGICVTLPLRKLLIRTAEKEPSSDAEENNTPKEAADITNEVDSRDVEVWIQRPTACGPDTVIARFLLPALPCSSLQEEEVMEKDEDSEHVRY